MFQETFEVSVKAGKRTKRQQVVEEDDGSDISDDDVEIDEVEEEEHNIEEYLNQAFSEVATVEAMGNREFMVEFFDQNVTLIEDDGDYDFELVNNIPTLYDTEYFIPFAEFLKNHEPELTGVTLHTNLEGGGQLTI